MAKKEFNVKLYGILSIIFVALILGLLTVRTFITRYNAFDPGKTASAYVSTIVETGDGYGAYKISLLSKNSKFGDYIRNNFIYPEIYENYEPGSSTKGLKGLNDESLKGEKTKNDNGALEGELIDSMYPYYKSLIEANNGWDYYDIIFKSYISRLKEQRKEIFGDDYFDDETFFTCIESNIKTYGEELTGTEDVTDKNTGVQISSASVGEYQKKYGDDYRFTVEIKESKDTDVIADTALYDISPDSIKGEKEMILTVRCGEETVIDEIKVYAVKIGHSWFIDNINTDTGILYNFYK